MREFRCLVFSDQEVTTAYVERTRRLHQPLPAGTVRDIEHDSSGGDIQNSTLTIIGDGGDIHRVDVRMVEMAASLVDFCLSRRVPIPMDAEKWLEVIRQHELVLLMTVGRKRSGPTRTRRLPSPPGRRRLQALHQP